MEEDAEVFFEFSMSFDDRGPGSGVWLALSVLCVLLAMAFRAEGEGTGPERSVFGGNYATGCFAMIGRHEAVPMSFWISGLLDYFDVGRHWEEWIGYELDMN